MNRKILSAFAALALAGLACNTLLANDEPTEIPHVDETEDAHDGGQPTMSPAEAGFPDRDALPNDSGIEGVQTFPDRNVYHKHTDAVEDPGMGIPPAFGAHLSAWQNCGIYDQPIELGHALHSLEHGAVWLTYAPDLPDDQVAALRDTVRGREFVLMSPYPKQTKPVVLTAWTVQLAINSLPDDRIAAFVAYYANGPQNPEPGAPCDGAIGSPIE